MGVNKKLLIYVVEDNKLYNKLVVNFLENKGLKKVKAFYNGTDCINTVKAGERPDIVIQDYHLDDSTGIGVLQAVKKKYKRTEFVFLTSNEDMEVAVNSIKYGAYDYIIKDNDLALKKVFNKIQKISKMLELQRRNEFIKRAMVVTLIVLMAIVIFVALHEFFDLFELKR